MIEILLKIKVNVFNNQIVKNIHCVSNEGNYSSILKGPTPHRKSIIIVCYPSFKANEELLLSFKVFINLHQLFEELP